MLPSPSALNPATDGKPTAKLSSLGPTTLSDMTDFVHCCDALNSGHTRDPAPATMPVAFPAVFRAGCAARRGTEAVAAAAAAAAAAAGG